MKLLRICKDEWYPVYSYYKEDGDFTGILVEVSDETFARWEKVMNEFEDLQDELRSLQE